MKTIESSEKFTIVDFWAIKTKDGADSSRIQLRPENSIYREVNLDLEGGPPSAVEINRLRGKIVHLRIVVEDS